jgi:hypothetical protein
VVKLNHTHEAIARWLIENPTRSLGECARQFGYTQSWLSCIIHSDAFQVKLHQMQQEADAVTIMDVPARLRGVAAAALDGLAQQVDHALSEGNGVLHRQFLHQTAELTLKALGYGQPKAPPPPAGSTHYHAHVHKHETVAPGVLSAAREKLLEAHAVQEARQLPASGDDILGSVQRLSSDLSASSPTEGAASSRADISGEGGSVSE